MNKPKIVSSVDVHIDPAKINANALQVVQRLQESGHQAYLVGGCVRDLILNLKPKDFDVATNATPEQVKKVFARNGRIIGRRFKIVHVRFGYEVIEVATFRASPADRDQVERHEMTESEEGRLIRDNIYGSIEEDVLRRDFTANSLYLDPVHHQILDYLGGIEDIQAKQLISIGDATTRFREDPVRMLRVVRFAAKLNFAMEPEALAIIEEEGKLLSHVSPARLFEEVLKLFHGGAAHRTYLMLREYGLFKYLFPFTDQMAVVDVEGMPELALKNTDLRIQAGKPVIPAFLFACMLWDPVKADAQILMDDGAKEGHAWRVAMNDALRDQNQYVAVPRRLAEIILDIWTIHFKLVKRSPKTIAPTLENRRFRAAYDFLLLRTQVHEVDEEITAWWTRIQEVDPAEKDLMIERLSASRSRSLEKQQNSSEPNGNSIDYPLPDDIGNQIPGVQTAKPKGARTPPHEARAGKKKRGKKRGRKVTTGRTPRERGQDANANANANANGVANPQAPANAGVKKKRQRNRKAGGRARKRGKQVDNVNVSADSRYVNARPRDEYGMHNSADADINRVKVRRKKRISVSEDGAVVTKNPDDASHF